LIVGNDPKASKKMMKEGILKYFTLNYMPSLLGANN